jgi:hypothetical protein
VRTSVFALVFSVGVSVGWITSQRRQPPDFPIALKVDVLDAKGQPLRIGAATACDPDRPASWTKFSGVGNAPEAHPRYRVETEYQSGRRHVVYGVGLDRREGDREQPDPTQ